MNLPVICSSIGVCSQAEEWLGRGGGSSLKSEGDCSVPHPSTVLPWSRQVAMGEQVREGKARTSCHSHVENTAERGKGSGRGESGKEDITKMILGCLLSDGKRTKI